MHSLLESYLSEVAAHLGPMPVKQRSEELREMRTHLENAAIVSCELGQTEEEAAQSIIAQFGPAQDLSENVVWAWRRGVTREKSGFWSAAACASTLVTLPALIPEFLTGSFGPHAPMPLVVFDLGIATPFAIPVVAAAILGNRYPKQAVSGTALGATLYGVCCAGEFLLVSHGHTLHFPNTLRTVAGFSGEGLAGLFAAWAGSRWSRVRRGLARQQ